MKMYPAVCFAFLMLLSVSGAAQTKPTRQDTTATSVQSATSSPAYAEVLLRKVELVSQLESLLAEYTDDHPKVVELKFAVEAIERERSRLLRVSAPELWKLSPALGKLMVRKTEHEIALWNLQKSYKDEHPEVKKAKRQVEIFEAAIKEILG